MGEQRPNPTSAIRNLRQPMPLLTKARLFVRNMGIRVIKRQTCCGHPGEPGC